MTPQPCDCRRHRHELLPQADARAIRWARCCGCGSLTRWTEAPGPTWLQQHAADLAVCGLPVAICLGWLLAGAIP